MMGTVYLHSLRTALLLSDDLDASPNPVCFAMPYSSLRTNCTDIPLDLIPDISAIDMLVVSFFVVNVKPVRNTPKLGR